MILLGVNHGGSCELPDLGQSRGQPIGSEVVSVSTCWRVEVGGDPGVLPCIGEEREDLGGFTHLVICCEFGQE